MHKNSFRVLAGIAAVMLAVVAFASGVSAHAEFESSVPEAGSTVAAAPATVTVTFSAEIQTSSVSFSLDVINDNGDSVTTGSAAVGADGTSLAVALQPNLPAGTYTVDWMNTSAEDGDAEEGSFTFAVGAAPVSQPTVMPEGDHHEQDHAHEDADAGGPVMPPTTGLIVVYLAEQGGSGVDGRAEIMPVDGGTRTQVGVYVGGITPGSSHMDHVHMESSCSGTPGPHAAELTDIASQGNAYGKSLTVIDVPFSVVADGTHTIRVHAGPTGGDKTTIACGTIPAQPEGPISLPSTGMSPDSPRGTPSALLAALAAGAALTLAGVAIRRRPEA